MGEIPEAKDVNQLQSFIIPDLILEKCESKRRMDGDRGPGRELSLHHQELQLGRWHTRRPVSQIFVLECLGGF